MSVPTCDYAPLRTLADIEAIERVPLAQRIARWDFAQNLLDGCRHRPHHPALHATRDGDVDGDVITWRFLDLERRAIQIANLLRADGLRADDAIAIVSPTVPALFAALIGGLLAARPFPINWMLDPHALGDLIRRSGAKAVIALGPTPGFEIDENVRAALAGLDGPLRRYTLHDPFATPHEDDLLAAAAAHPATHLAFERQTAQQRDIACYVHSGGTTGHPKIVKILHGGMVYRQWAANNGLASTPDDVVLSDTPLFHIGGLLVRGLVNTANGNTSILPSMHGARDKTYLAHYWRFVERFGITQISGVPTTLSVLAKHPPTTEDIRSLRPYFATGSAAIPPAIQERIATLTGARTLQSYGMTENTSHATLDPRDGEIRRGCSGIRVPYMTVRVVEMDRDGRVRRELPPGEIGMIVVGGPGVAGGYLDPSQDQGAFLPDGSFVTGDLGSLDADGYIRISGRLKDLIIRGGHNIEPAQIENALLSSPWVAVAAAVGKPDAHAGELPIAYVELHPGADVTAEELLRYAAQRIPERPAVPKEIIFLDKLPLTSVGKPIKHLLQRDAAQRTLEAALQAVPGPWELRVTNTGGSGLATTLLLHNSSPGARSRAEAVLSAYTLPYTIEQRDEHRMNTLTLQHADRIADDTLAEGRTRGFAPLTVAILDAGGHLIVLKRADGASILRPDLAQAKAWGALGMGFGGRELARRAQAMPGFFQALSDLSDGRMIPVPGSALIRDADGRILGAVGVSGDTSEHDEDCLVPAVRAAGFTADTGAQPTA